MQIRRRRFFIGSLGLGILFLAGHGAFVAGADKATVKPLASGDRVHNPFPQRTQLPDDLFEGGTGWLNVSGPIELRDLRGKIVLVDFWTFCCINCMHILPDLKYLEHKYPRDLVVIGVHSAKFDNERDSENIRRAILRYDIEHPVLNDSHMAIWRKLSVNSWPTLILIDPEGKFVGRVSGEGNREVADSAIGKLVAYHKATGTLDRASLRLGLESRKLAASPLKFPGKVLADEKSGRLFIADSGHNRIVICTTAGKLIDVAGTGEVGAKNGPFAAATFHHPQGMALDGSKLYVADTENHLIRQLDLDQKVVTMLAGIGKQAALHGAGGRLRSTALNSPWDLILVKGTLYIAMAGAHQIWSHPLGSDHLHVFAGDGREDVLNGLREESAFAQPSGIATDGKSLFVADSEGSAIRAMALHAGTVTTLAGTSDLPSGQSLFMFGDENGIGMNARFQHPLGLTYHAGHLYVADSYNHKIKIVDVAGGEAKTWLGSGHRGDSLEPAEFSEPGGLSIADGALFIADTNNHAIKVADLKTRSVKALTIDGLASPAPLLTRPEGGIEEKTTADLPAKTAGQQFEGQRVAAQRVAAVDAFRLEFSFILPGDYKLNKLAPATCRLRAREGAEFFKSNELGRVSAAIEGDKAVVMVPLAGKPGKALLEASLSYTYCREGVGGLCKFATSRWTVPIELAPDAKLTAVKLIAEIHDH